MNSKRNASSLPAHLASNLTRSLLAAAVIGGISLTGCGRSGAGEAANTAETASDHAARLAASAGETRLKPDFADKIKGKDWGTAKQEADQATSAIKSDQLNQRGAWKAYLEQKSVAQDLEAAADALKKAIDSPEFTNAALKSSVQSQLGSTKLAEARVNLRAAQDRLMELTERAAQLQAFATYVNELGAQAAAQESRAKGDQPADVSKLQSAIDDRKAETAKAQAALDDLEKQASDKKAQAAKIYADTDAAFAAVDDMKGTAAVDAAKKAAEDRKAADKLSEEAANMTPGIAQAKSELEAAKIKQAESESLLAAATSANTQSDIRSKGATDLATALHEQAKKLLEGPDGLGARYKQFAEDAAAVADDVKKAQSAARDATTAYTGASQSQAKFGQDVAALNLPDTDPLTNSKARESEGHLKALLQLGQAASHEELARANLIAFIVSQTRANLGAVMASAYTSAGEKLGEETPALDKDASDNALREFDTAATSAGQVANAARDGAPEKWLAYTIQAVAFHGSYIINGQNRDKYEEAAKNAQAQNPFLDLSPLLATNKTR